MKETGTYTIVFQTGINNVINTSQSDENIRYQVKCLIRENVNKRKNLQVIFTSIIPSNIYGSDTIIRVKELNRTLENIVTEEGGVFLDLDRFFTRGFDLVENLYRQEEYGLLYLNDAGLTVLAHVINSSLENEDIETTKRRDFQWERNRYRGRWTERTQMNGNVTIKERRRLKSSHIM